MRMKAGIFGLLCCTATIPAHAAFENGSLNWRAFEVPEYGTRVDYPAGIFVAVREPEKGIGQRFETEDGRAALSIYVRENEDNETPASYLRRNLRQRLLDYERVTSSFFAISMLREGTIYYSRCNFSHAARSSIHCFDLVYPQAEKRDWDPIVTRISLSLRPLER
jgi:hypothetical protein